MANDCCGTMRVVARDKGAIDRFEKIMQYNDDEFFCYRVFEFERSGDVLVDGDGYWVAEYATDVAWGSDKWFHDSDKPNEKIRIGYNKKTYYREDGTSYVADNWDSPIYGTAHYTSVTHLCGVLGIGVELWTTEPGCGFEEHAMCDNIGRMRYETAEYREECTDDGEIVGEKHGFKDFGDWHSASEIYGGANTCPMMGGKGERMKYRIKILEVLSTIREIEAPNVDAAIAKAEDMYARGELVLELETNSTTVVNEKEVK